MERLKCALFCIDNDIVIIIKITIRNQNYTFQFVILFFVLMDACLSITTIQKQIEQIFVGNKKHFANKRVYAMKRVCFATKGVIFTIKRATYAI